MDLMENMSLKSKTGSGNVAGKLHDVVITEFLDKYFIIISDNGKIGTLVETVFETNAMKTSTSLTSKVLFGKDEIETIHTQDFRIGGANLGVWQNINSFGVYQFATLSHINTIPCVSEKAILDTFCVLLNVKPEIHAVAQSIVEVLKIKKPVVFGFSAKEYNSTTAVDMRQLIAGMLGDSEQNNLHNLSSIP